MRTFKIFLFFILFISSTSSFAQWNSTSNIIELGYKVSTFGKKDNYWFVSVPGTGIYRRDTLQTKWVYSSNGLTDNQIQIIKSNKDYVFAINANIFRSSNHGESWTQLFFPGGNITSFLCNNDTLYASGMWGLYVSYNNGNIWSLLNTSMYYVYNLQKVGNKMYASRNQNISMSTNNGANWNVIHTFKSNEFDGQFCAKQGVIMAIRSTPGASGYNRIYRSTNDGVSWDYTSFSLLTSFGNFFIDNNNHIYIPSSSSPSRIIKTTNNGLSWTTLSGFPNGYYKNLFAENNSILTGTNDIGCYVSSNGGTSWSIYNSGLTSLNVTEINKLSNGFVVLVPPIGRFKTTNEGLSWNYFTYPLYNGNNVKIYAKDSTIFYGSAVSTISLKSTNFGISWDSVGSIPFPYFAYENSFAEGNEVLSTGDMNPLVRRSTNYGSTWQNITSNLSVIFASCIYKKDSYIFLGTTNNGIHRYDEGTGLWTHLNQLSTNNISFFYKLNDYLYTVSNELYRSSDNGNNWSVLSGTTGVINVMKSYNNTLIIGTTNGFYYSNDYGDTWIQYNTGLPFTNVKLIEVYNNKVYIALSGKGIWWIPVSQIVNISTINSGVPEFFKLYDNFPNPFNPTTKIRFDIARSGKVEMSVYDITGREITELVKEELTVGSYEVIFNAQNLSSGIYFYTLKTSDFVSSKKMNYIK